MKARAFAIVLAALILASAPAAQLPPVSWTCPMHPDVLEDKKSACSICGMDLEPIRLVTMFTCPVHAVIEQAKPGKCRICARDLVAMTAGLTFTCQGSRQISQLEPGTCTDGTPMVARYTKRAHGDHNPKHGGIFFMAPDNWHHLEGVYPTAGRFRVYVYDDYSRPLAAAEARKIRGRVVTKETFDPKTGTTHELASAPLVLARNGAFLEARIEVTSLPAKMTAKISFRPEDKESRFDFVFPAFTRDLGTTPNAPMAVVAAPTPSATRPEPDALLTDLRARRQEVESLVQTGALGGIYLPALQAKDMALELQARVKDAKGIDQEAVESRVKEIVLNAYQLDNFGDLGDGEKVQDAYRAFSAAITELDALVAGRP